MGREAGDLVAQTLRGDDGDLIADLLVRVEVEREAGVVSGGRVSIGYSIHFNWTSCALFDDDARCALDGLGAYTTLKKRKIFSMLSSAFSSLQLGAPLRNDAQRSFT
jgi:hypothetical protein